MSSRTPEYFDEAQRILEHAQALLAPDDSGPNETARGHALATLGLGYAAMAIVERMRFDALRGEIG